ncbi:response regulator [Coraliomargarita parva]|uniref:response regulator n=1 Tax=Coraliomargarita parva TaxID=3014050 RepID=UPI0022B4354B|nr:response regulator [Coraliomargarita parva]
MSKPIHTACIIDDDDTFVFLTKRMILIKKLCERVLIYANGRVALDELTHNLYDRDELPDLILLDINMPEMDGWEFLDAFSKIKHDLAKPITIYLITSSVDEADLKRARQYGDVSQYIVKPVDLKSLAELFHVNLEEPAPRGD